jgi:hypothetical protein
MKKQYPFLFIVLFLLLIIGRLFGQNPLIRDQFTADPSARVFGDRVYVFPSHDIRCEEGQGRGPDWFCMEDYHVFSSDNLTDWKDHGVIVSQTEVPWADPEGFHMWAPDAISRNGKYYFYFPAFVGDTVKYWRGFGLGVAVADHPEGPYTPQDEPIDNIMGIDPNVFIDKDGQAYLYWSIGHIFGAKLKENMLELDSEPVIIQNLPALDKGLKEGPYLFERNGIYYMTYPHVENNTERLEYAVGDNPLGPFEVKGVIMDESPTGCWTNHHSVIEYKGQWYLFYHHNDLSPDFDKNRSIRMDSLFFKEDGSIQKVTPTLRGVGLTDASGKIQIDRYSQISDQGASIAFLDKDQPFEGWKSLLENQGGWIRYDAVDFGTKAPGLVRVKALSPSGGKVQIRLAGGGSTVIAEAEIPSGKTWNTYSVPVSTAITGTQNLMVSLKNGDGVEIDWISFQ